MPNFTLEEQRRFWSRWDAHYWENQLLDAVSVRRADTVLDWLTGLHLDQPRILELGCANGWLSEKLAQYGPVTGLDLADEVIARAKARCPYIDFRASAPATA